jgi:hypothetical protein
VTFETDCRPTVETALAQHLGHTGETTRLPSPGGGSVAYRVAGRGGRSAELTASRTKLEARLSRPARTVTLEGDYEDTDLLARDASSSCVGPARSRATTPSGVISKVPRSV